jgi:HYR domain
MTSLLYQRLATIFFLVTFAVPALADTKTWDGDGGDGLWSNPLNWNNNSVPEDGDLVRLDRFAQIRMNVDTTLLNGQGIETTPGFNFGTLTIEPGVTLTTQHLYLDYGIIDNYGAVATPGSGVLVDIRIGGAFLNIGSLENGLIELDDGARLENRSGGTITNARFQLSADADLINGGLLPDASFTLLADGATITNSGSMTVVHTSTLATAGGLLINTGSITNHDVIKNRGTIDNTSGLIDNRDRIFNECTSTTSDATPAIFLGAVSGNPVVTTCRIFDNDSGNRLWSDPANWSGNGIPQQDDLVVIADVDGVASSPILDVNFEIKNELIVHAFSILTVNAGQMLTNKGTLTVRGGVVYVEPGATFRNEAEMTYSRSSTGTGNLANYGTFVNTSSAKGEFRNGSWFYNQGSSRNEADSQFDGKLLEFQAGSRFENVTDVLNNGIITVNCDVDFRNSGELFGHRYIGLCKRWDGGGGTDTNWSNPLNWNNDSLPQDNDAVLIDVPGVVTVDQDVSFSLSGSLTTGPGFVPGILTIPGGVELAINKLFLRAGLIENRGNINSGSNQLFVELEVGALFSNQGTMSRLLADVLPGGEFDNRFGTVTDSRFDLHQDATLGNLGTLTDVGISTREGNGARILNDGDMTDMRSVFLGNGNDYFDNNGLFENHGELFNRGVVEHSGQMFSTAGTLDNAGTFVLECGYLLLGIIEGNPAIVDPCDVTPPVISTFGSLTFEATSSSGAVIAYSATAIDETDGPVPASCAPANSAVLNLGTHGITCSASDAAGNVGELDFDVSVVDTTSPVISLPADVTAEATGIASAVSIGMATASDYYLTTLVNDAPATFALGTTDVTWTANDSSGNEASAVQVVTVVDTTPPDLAAPPDVSVEATAPITPVVIGNATASDIFGVTISNDAPAGFALGTTTVTWTAVDDNGNSSTATQKVTVSDTTPPELSVPSDIVAEANGIESVLDPGVATATDIFDVTITSDAPPSYPLGTTIINWTATDTSGNSASGTQSVTVVDTTPPELSVPDDITVTAQGPLTAIDIGTASATDIFPVTISNDAPTTGYMPGITQVTWRAEDANGNVSTVVQAIRVEYAFGGFTSPLSNGVVYKLNRAVPVKFQLYYADGSPVLTAIATIQLQQLASGEPSGDVVDGESPGSANSGNVFRLSGDTYIFNLSTKGLSKGVYRLLVAVDDASALKAVDIGIK